MVDRHRNLELVAVYIDDAIVFAVVVVKLYVQATPTSSSAQDTSCPG